MAKSYGILWSTYYEQWEGELFGCYYKHDFVNEWGIISHESGLFSAGFYPILEVVNHCLQAVFMVKCPHENTDISNRIAT